jgi:putative Ca2+/H+ antiporter (TMEM165/GDT1 family)
VGVGTVSETFFGVLLIAFGYQLLVLPGEKVQFIIAGLSTRFHPLLVVAAAGSAFAGWTALEIAVGRQLARLLPPTVLTLLSGCLFLVFAYLLYRSAPAPDDGGLDPDAATAGDEGEVSTDGAGGDLDVSVFGRRIPNYLGGFVPIFAMMAVGEFGDKTQLITFSLASKYGGTHPEAIWLGEMLAIVPVSLANAYFFSTFTHKFDRRKAHLFAAGLFGFFAFDTFLGFATAEFLGQKFTVWGTLVDLASQVVFAIL